MKSQGKYNDKGITLVETLIVVALSLVIIVISAPLYGAFFTTSQIDERIDELIQTLRLTRERAAARVDDLPQGVHLVINLTGADEYVLYEGASYVPDPSERRIKLEDSLALSTTIAGADINFSRGMGVPNATGFITITQNGGVARTIQVNQYGAVQKE